MTSPTQDAEPLKFTGHERDFANPASVADDLDYMHARHYSPVVGRFISTDSIRWANLSEPQGWNLYSYTRGNPLRLVDRDGRQALPFPTSPADAIRNFMGYVRRLFGMNVSMSSPESSDIQRALEGAAIAAITVKTFGDVFSSAEPDEESGDIRRKEGTPEQAKAEFDASVDPDSVREVDNGVFVGRDRETGRTLIFREKSTDKRSSATLEEQRKTKSGKVRSRKVRYDPPPTT